MPAMQQRGCVENSGESGQPGLVVVLRAEIGDGRIGDVAFEDFGRGALPIVQELLQRLHAIRLGVAAEQFAGRGRRAGPRVEQDDIDFAAREGLIDHRQVAEHEREKAEAEAAFDHSEEPPGGSVRDDVAQAEREERRPAEIEARFEVAWRRNLMGGAVKQQSEAHNERRGPEYQQREKRKRPVKAEERFARADLAERAGDALARAATCRDKTGR